MHMPEAHAETPAVVVVVPALEYPAYHGGVARCALAFTQKGRAVEALVVELEANHSTSITNAAEAVLEAVWVKLEHWLSGAYERSDITLTLFEAYEYRIRALRGAGNPTFADPFGCLVRAHPSGFVGWDPLDPEMKPVVERLTKALVAAGAICPEHAEAAMAS